jgi:hypothetical protein
VISELANDFASPELISEIGPDNGCIATVQFTENFIPLNGADSGQHECVQFGGYEVRGDERRPLADESSPQFMCGSIALVSLDCHGEER